MPGRGRGSFGTKFSFDLGALGFGGRFGLSQLTSAHAPPSAFPPLDARPARLVTDNEHEYLVELSRNFHSLVNDSPFYLRPLKAPKPFIERYTDLVEKDGNKQGKSKWPLPDQWPIDWDRFPMELRPPSLRNRGDNVVSIEVPPTASGNNNNKKGTEKPSEKTDNKKRAKKGATKNVDGDEEEGLTPNKKKRRLRVKEEEVDDETIEKRFTELEKLEQQPDGGLLPASSIKQELVDIPEVEPVGDEGEEEGKPGGGGGDKEGEPKKKAGSDEEDEASDEEGEAAEEDFDEEMGDYGDDYFDNGEAYDDEDDGDNEGPTY